MIFKKIVMLFVFSSVVAFASCDCSNSVENNYERIKKQVPNHFKGIEDKLEDTKAELDEAIKQKERELELIEKAIDNKYNIVVLHEKEVSQLAKMHEYVKNQGEAKILGAKTETSKTQNSILNNMQDIEKNSQETFWKK
ncbi:hypothetical protein [Aliarcobacter butzleri]|uniref:hypothetical protein n=1 Tax=Aliarcobacter butzleri TaxID=28197 RepID=UPI001269BC8A|nr:hypothetical protein [Aliarcobacter butzleri]